MVTINFINTPLCFAEWNFGDNADSAYCTVQSMKLHCASFELPLTLYELQPMCNLHHFTLHQVCPRWLKLYLGTIKVRQSFCLLLPMRLQGTRRVSALSADHRLGLIAHCKVDLDFSKFLNYH